MQDSNKNQSNLGNKKPNQSNPKQGQKDKGGKFTNNSDIKQPGKNPPTQQDRTTKR